MRSRKEQKRQGRRFWSDASLSGLWSKGPDGGWPLVGFKGRSSQNVTRMSKSCRAVRAAPQRERKGKKPCITKAYSKSPARARDERERKRCWGLRSGLFRPWVQVLPWPFFSVSSGLVRAAVPCSLLPPSVPSYLYTASAVSIATPAVCMVSVKPHFGITFRLLPYLASYML